MGIKMSATNASYMKEMIEDYLLSYYVQVLL